MKRYVVKTGQNLYDVALMLYGSIEGIFDLLTSNKDINLNTNLKSGQILNWNEEFMIEQSVSDWFKNHDVIVKNGNKSVNNVSFSDSIDEHIISQNNIVTNEIASGKLYLPWGAIMGTKPRFPFTSQIDETRGIFSSDSDVRFSTEIDSEFEGEVRNLNSLLQKLSAIGISFDINSTTEWGAQICLRRLYIAGMTLLPENSFDKKVCLSQLANLKMLVYQTGNYSSFGIQLRPNKLVIVDWGDGTPLEYTWYQDDMQYLSHQYNDYGSHVIKIYGNTEYVNLDFTKLNGVYYPMNAIFIERKFVTPFVNTEKLNRLFIIK